MWHLSKNEKAISNFETYYKITCDFCWKEEWFEEPPDDNKLVKAIEGLGWLIAEEYQKLIYEEIQSAGCIACDDCRKEVKIVKSK